MRDADAGIAGGETVLRHIHPGLWWVAALNTEAWLQLHLNAERAKPASAGGRLHPSRSLVLGYGVNPAPWFTRFNAELDVGERLDVDADRVGRGAVWLLEAKLRAGLPNGWGLESEQRVQQGFIQGRDGNRALTDTAAQWLGVLHLSARDSLRVLWQHSRLTRAEDVTAGVPAQASRDTVASLVAQRRLGVGRVLSAGLSRQSREPLGARETELFVKASFELMP